MKMFVMTVTAQVMCIIPVVLVVALVNDTIILQKHAPKNAIIAWEPASLDAKPVVAMAIPDVNIVMDMVHISAQFVMVMV